MKTNIKILNFVSCILIDVCDCILYITKQEILSFYEFLKKEKNYNDLCLY